MIVLDADYEGSSASRAYGEFGVGGLLHSSETVGIMRKGGLVSVFIRSLGGRGNASTAIDERVRGRGGGWVWTGWV